MYKNQKGLPAGETGVAHLLLLIAAVGLIAFLLISNTVGFKDKLFSALFPKPQSQAAEEIGSLNSDLDSIKQGSSKLEDSKVIEKAKRRKELLLQEIETEPKSFLAHAKFAKDKAGFSAEVQKQLESEFDDEGILSRIHIDYPDDKKIEYKYVLSKLKDSKVKSYEENWIFFSDKAESLVLGKKVKLKGIKLGTKVAAIIPQVLGTTIDYTLKTMPTAVGEKLAVILVKTKVTEPYSKEYAVSSFFSNIDSIKNYLSEYSYNKFTLTGDIFGWYTLPSSVCNDFNEYKNAIDSQLASQGVDLSSFTQKIYLINRERGCIDGSSAGYNTRDMVVTVTDPNRDRNLIIHEFGHNLGLFHGSSWGCGNKAIDDYSRCTNWEYGDYLSAMGGYFTSHAWHYSASNKWFLGWLTSDQVLKVTNDGVYTINPIERLSPGLMALKIRKTDMIGVVGFYPTIIDEHYYVEYRQPIGFDLGIDTQATGGVTIRVARTFDIQAREPLNGIHEGFATHLIDTTPLAWLDASLSDGGVFYDPINRILVKQISHNFNGATVDVKLNVDLPPPSSPPSTASAKRVFVTSQSFSGNLGGRSGADQKCQVLADAKGLGGKFRAWVSDKTGAISTDATFTKSLQPYKRIDGAQIVSSFTNFVRGLEVPINIDEKGLAYSTSQKVWTGTKDDGSLSGASPNCSNWTSSQSGDKGRVGLTDVTGSNWTDKSTDTCNNSYKLYCFEQ